MFLRDPVEQTEEYKDAMLEIQPILDREFPNDSLVLGTCGRYWERKKELLFNRYEIVWRSPAEMNLDVIFD